MRAHCYMESMATLRNDELFLAKGIGYKPYNKKTYMDKEVVLYKPGPNGHFVKVLVADINRTKKVRNDLEVYDCTWFKWNKTLYVTSKAFDKIIKVSEYWTHEGQTMLMNRRMQYINMKRNPSISRLQLKPLKLIPLNVE